MKSVLLSARILLFGLISVFQFQAHSAEVLLAQDYKVELPSVEQLSQLKTEQQDIYWLGLRALVLELEEIEGSADKAYAQNNFFNLFINKAYANVENLCVYAGFLLQRTGDNLCPRPPACQANANLIQCNPLLYGPDVCVSRGKKATASCERSARLSSKVREYRNQNPRSWAIFQDKVQEYCRKGKQASPCRMIRSRLDEIRQTVGSPVQIPQQMSAVRTYQEAARNTAAVTLEPVGATSGYDGGCYSEALVSGIRLSSETTQLIEPEVAYRAFCQGDVDYLKSVKSELLQSTKALQVQSERATKRSQARYEQIRLKEQHRRIVSSIAILKKCIAHVESGKKIPSSNSGTLEFSAGTVKILGKNGKIPMFGIETGIAGFSVLSRQGLGSRFCDYSLISRKSGVSAPAAAGDTAAPIKSDR